MGSAWQIWLIVAGCSFILEVMTVGFLVFWFGVAAIITAFLSFFITNTAAQIGIFVVLSTILIFFTRKLSNKLTKDDNTVTNSQTVVGKTGIVTKEIDVKNHKLGQVKVDSEVWSATCEDSKLESISVGTKVKVKEISGVKIIVTPEK